MSRVALFVSLVLGPSFLVVPGSADEAETRELVYDVARNGQPIGTHRLRLRRDGPRRVLEHRVRIRVRVFGLEAYRYDLSARETWERGRLVALAARVDDNGAARGATVRRSGSGFAVEGPGGRRGAAPADAIAADPHLEVLQPGRARMIEAEDGAVRRVTIEGPRRERRRVGGRERPVRRFEVRGEHRATLWYGADGVLVEKRIEARDGSTVTTRLR